MAALRMDHNQRPKVIYAYPDGQAVDDGFLVDIIRRGPLNRVSRAVFDTFSEPMGETPLGTVMDMTRLMGVIDTMLKVEPDSEGWRTATVEGKELWMVPNEVDGLTLLFPDDW